MTLSSGGCWKSLWVLIIPLLIFAGCDLSADSGGAGNDPYASYGVPDDPYDLPDDEWSDTLETAHAPEPATGLLFLCATASAAVLRYARRRRRRDRE